MLVDNIFFNSMSIPLLIQMLRTPSTFPSCKSILFPWLACYFVSGSHSDKISLLFKKKTLFVIYHRHLKLGNWQPHVNLLHVTDQYFLLDCITCILFLIILQLGPYLRFWIGCMYSFYTFVKSYYWKQIFYVMSILCTFNMYKLTYHVLITVHHWVISPHHIIFHFSTIHFIHKLLGVSRIYSKNLVSTELSFLMYSQFEKKMKIPYK